MLVSRGRTSSSTSDWHFTPTHISSKSLITLHWFGPPAPFLPVLQPDMGRSLWFSGPLLPTYRPVRCFGLRVSLNLAGNSNSPVHFNSTPSRMQSAPTVCRHTVSGSFIPPGFFFSPSLTLAHTVHISVSALRVVPPEPHKVFVPVVLWILLHGLPTLPGSHRLWPSFPDLVLLRPTICDYSPQPQSGFCPVWALPCSLAATEGILLTFFSSGHLDVSVHRLSFR